MGKGAAAGSAAASRARRAAPTASVGVTAPAAASTAAAAARSACPSATSACGQERRAVSHAFSWAACWPHRPGCAPLGMARCGRLVCMAGPGTCVWQRAHLGADLRQPRRGRQLEPLAAHAPVHVEAELHEQLRLAAARQRRGAALRVAAAVCTGAADGVSGDTALDGPRTPSRTLGTRARALNATRPTARLTSPHKETRHCHHTRRQDTGRPTQTHARTSGPLRPTWLKKSTARCPATGRHG
jgi:hypothetical protein